MTRWTYGVVSVALAAGCSSHASGSGFAPLDDGGVDASAPQGDASGGGGGGSSSDSAIGHFGTDSSGGSGGTCVITSPTQDMDKDGWSPMQGDCNDCDPNVNPGAIDVLHTPDGGAPYWGDEDCSGTAGDSAATCDDGLSLDDVAAGDAAKAIELCATATASDRKFGVLSAAYVRADGTAFASPALQVGLEPAFGTNVKTQAGKTMLVLSSGHARTVGQAGACNNLSCQTNTTATPPTGFPQDDPQCPPTPAIADDVALELQLRAPTNATGYAFHFKFYSFEYPDYVCDPSGYNDQFVVLVQPPPKGAYVPSGSMLGNIAFDSNDHPVSVNMGFFDVCDPSTPSRFASHCTGSNCPTAPSPYCPLGMGDLAGTGFDVWHVVSSKPSPAGATRWLETQAPVQGGSTFTVRFAMWDAGNAQFDSTVLIDDFQWIATGGTVVVGTMPTQAQ